MNAQPHHRWNFFRAGGFDQVRIESGQDFLHLDQLDRKLWVALACPTQGLEFDPKTLALLDTDHDGRIRSPEIIAAAKWTASLLKNPDDLVHSRPALPLAAINDATPEGHTLFSSARQILINLGKDGDQPGAEITPEDTADTARIFANTSFNGDGVLPADGAGDAGGAALEAIINDIIACFGSQADRSGKPGITQDRVDQFFDEAQRVEDACAHNAERLMPLGEKTPAAFELISGLSPRINHYFTLVGLAAYAPAAAEAIHRAQEDYPTIASTPEALAGKLNELPLARIEPGRALPLKEGINPAYQAAVGRLRDEVVVPLLAEQSALSEEQWRAIEERFSVFAAVRHMAVTKLGFKRVREIVVYRAAGVDARAAISALIAKDKALEPEANSIAEVDKLVRYHRDLFQLLNNFVGFRDFYARRGKAIFQAGTLYLDQRACDLCVRVDDPAKHALMAHLARTYLAYCDITRKGTDGMEKMSIAAAYTAGDSDNLMVGRNGVFFDRLGRDWDATITKIIENPISIRQAFFSPYKRALRAIGDQLAKRAAAADAQATERIQTAAANAAVAATTGVVPPPLPPPAPKPKLDVGVVAALGVALGALSTAFGYFLGWLGSVHLYLLPVYVLAIILLISLPSMLIAWFKLRQRNLGPILDANGWAVNAKAKINLPFGRSLTHTPKLPPGSRHNLVDPFAEKHTARNCVIAAVIIAAILFGCWYFGLAERVAAGVFPASPFMQWQKAKQAQDAEAAGTVPAAPSVPAAARAPASQNAGK